MGGRQPGKALTPPAEKTIAGGENEPDFLPETPQNTPLNTTSLPEGATITDEGEVLFKQTRELFKQIHDHSGKVIGLMYKGPRMQSFTTLSEAQVRSRHNIYRSRADKEEVSEAVSAGINIWQWALSLYGKGDWVRKDNLETIHEPEEAVTP